MGSSWLTEPQGLAVSSAPSHQGWFWAKLTRWLQTQGHSRQFLCSPESPGPFLASKDARTFAHMLLRSQQNGPGDHPFTPRDHQRDHTGLLLAGQSAGIQTTAETFSGAFEKLLFPVSLRRLWDLELPSNITSHWFQWPLWQPTFLPGMRLWFLGMTNGHSEPSPLKALGNGFWGPRWLHRYFLVTESTLGSRSQPGTETRWDPCNCGSPATRLARMRSQMRMAVVLSWEQASVPVTWWIESRWHSISKASEAFYCTPILCFNGSQVYCWAGLTTLFNTRTSPVTAPHPQGQCSLIKELSLEKWPYFKKLYWSVVDLQHCIGLRCTTKSIRFT